MSELLQTIKSLNSSTYCKIIATVHRRLFTIMAGIKHKNTIDRKDKYDTETTTILTHTY